MDGETKRAIAHEGVGLGLAPAFEHGGAGGLGDLREGGAVIGEG
jgi:hypothetical protein